MGINIRFNEGTNMAGVLPNYVKPVRWLEGDENAYEVYRRRYSLKDSQGNPKERPHETFYRVADHVANAGRAITNDPDNDTIWESVHIANTNIEKFYRLMAERRFMPNSPTFTGAGTPLGQLAACFVLPIEDDMGAHPDGIFSVLRKAALIQQTGGGNGFSFSRLRPKGDTVHSSGGRATGPGGFLRVFDAAFGEVAQGGVRRGANMAILRVDHPDIEEFIGCKAEEGDVTNFNISVAITDEFMQAVKDDDDFDLTFHDKHYNYEKVYRTMRARELFDKIVDHAYRNGEPGVVFIDTAEKDNPIPHLYRYEATNPCSEQWLGSYENCCLGSINLLSHVRRVDDEASEESGIAEYEIDWYELRKTVRDSVDFLDSVVDANTYVEAVPELREAALRARRIGLGIMGLADVMYRLGVRYGSLLGEILAGSIMEFVRYHAMMRSIELAKEYGVFPAFEGSIYDAGQPGGMKWEPPHVVSHWPGRPDLDWVHLRAQLMHHGIRNAAQTTIAPTGTIATVSGLQGYGCEPVFALGYTRHVKEDDGNLDLEYFNPIFLDTCETFIDRIDREEIMRTGSCQKVRSIPREIRETLVVSSDVTPHEHVRMQAAMQRWVDSGISKTINLPADATREDVAEVYGMAWELGCKGITVYVTGSREDVVLETEATKSKKTSSGSEVSQEQTLKGIVNADPGDDSPFGVLVDDQGEPVPLKEARPEILEGRTYKKETGAGTAYVTVNHAPGDGPFEVFVNVGKPGEEIRAVSEAFGRMISLYLRTPGPVDRMDRLGWLVDELLGIRGANPVGFGKNRVYSLADGIGQVLRQYIQDRNQGDFADEFDEVWDALHDRGLISLNEARERLGVGANIISSGVFHVNGDISDLGNIRVKSSATISASSGDLCPDCGQPSLVTVEGCGTCQSCGYSKCG